MDIKQKFISYTQLSTKKTASGMADNTVKSLMVYVNKYSIYTQQYRYDTFLQYLKDLEVASNTKAFIANSMGRFLWIEGFINDSEFKKLRSSFRSEYRVWSGQHVSDDTIRLFIQDIEQDSYKPFYRNRNLLVIALLSLTSLRVSQISALNRQDLIFTENTIEISINEKKRNSNDVRGQKRVISVPLETQFYNFQLIDLFDNWFFYNDTDMLFITEDCNRMSIRQIQRFIKTLADNCNVEVTPHTFRHEAITRATNKMGIHTGAILAGHKSISTTMKYVNPEYIDISDVFSNFME